MRSRFFNYWPEFVDSVENPKDKYKITIADIMRHEAGMNIFWKPKAKATTNINNKSKFDRERATVKKSDVLPKLNNNNNNNSALCQLIEKSDCTKYKTRKYHAITRGFMVSMLLSKGM